MTTGDRTGEGAGADRHAGGARASERIGERARAREILDLQEGRGRVPLLDDDAIASLLQSARRIAVVGASSNRARPSFGVFEFLVNRGYECVPVNPNERDVMGVRAFPTLTEAVEQTGSMDIVDVFRRPDACADVARETVAVGAGCLWLQLGVVNWEAARIAAGAGLAVVMDRCTAIEHRRMRGSG